MSVTVSPKVKLRLEQILFADSDGKSVFTDCSSENSDYSDSGSDFEAELNDGKETHDDLRRQQSKVSVKKSHSKAASMKSKSPGILFACSVTGCCKQFKRQTRLVEHERVHTGERPFTCPFESCHRSYSRNQHLSRHIAACHQSQHSGDSLEKKVSCDKCPKMFLNVFSLRNHKYRIHVRSARQYTCTFCALTFKKQQHLKTHTFIHTGIKPYACEVPDCEARYENPSKLKRHVKVHIKGRYRCEHETCSQVFDRFTDLQVHLSVSHPQVCDICGKVFASTKNFTAHRHVHDDMRAAFFCPDKDCDRYYYNESSLRQHFTARHDQSERFKCTKCNKSFAAKHCLFKHGKVHEEGYVRNFNSKKPRQPRKDKGKPKMDIARVLSGYHEVINEGGKGSNLSEVLNEEVNEQMHTESQVFKIIDESERMDVESNDDHVIM